MQIRFFLMWYQNFNSRKSKLMKLRCFLFSPYSWGYGGIVWGSPTVYSVYSIIYRLFRFGRGMFSVTNLHSVQAYVEFKSVDVTSESHLATGKSSSPLLLQLHCSRQSVQNFEICASRCLSGTTETIRRQQPSTNSLCRWLSIKKNGSL